MADLQATNTLVGETSSAIGANVGPKIQEILQELGLSDVQGWFHLLRATAIAPDPISVDLLHSRAPYTARHNFEQVLTTLAEQGYLKATEGGFVATEKAADIIETLLDTQRVLLKDLDANINRDNALQVIDSLSRITAAISALDKPQKAAFNDQVRRPATFDLPVTEQYVRYGAGFNTFRDDAHIASWTGHGVDGHAWEIFSYLWREEEMPEQLVNNRGFTPEEDATAIKDLVSRGWVEPTGEEGKFQVTEAGKQLRQEAEDQTDKYFFAAWHSLSEAEISKLAECLTKLRDELRALVPQPQN